MGGLLFLTASVIVNTCGSLQKFWKITIAKVAAGNVGRGILRRGEGEVECKGGEAYAGQEVAIPYSHSRTMAVKLVGAASC